MSPANIFFKKTRNRQCHHYLVGTSQSFKNIYSSGKISQGRQSLDLCCQRVLALCLQVHHNLSDNSPAFKAEAKRKSFTLLPGPIVLLAPNDSPPSFKFPRSTKEQLRGKEADVSVF